MSRPALLRQEHHPPQPGFREIALSASWHGGVPSDLTTTDGRQVRVIHRGTWSHGFGPDFRDAILEFDGRDLITGDVEIHLTAEGWRQHGHHIDPRYNQVVLHVVLRADGTTTQREDGQIVPVSEVSLADDLLFSIDRSLPAIWDQLGSSVCAANLALREPRSIRAALNRLGDQRLHERAARFGGDLEVIPTPRVLLRGLFDAFGYSMNRDPMALLYQRLEETGLLGQWEMDPAAFTPNEAMAVLFGLGGFLPLCPADTHLAGIAPDSVPVIEAAWTSRFTHLAEASLPATSWVRARTRPANHPAARLASLARLLAACGANPLAALQASVLEGRDPRTTLRDLCQAPNGSTLGLPRATSIVASVVLPLLLACAQRDNDPDLEDAVSRAWTHLPRSEWSRSALRARQQVAGDVPLGTLGERAVQGLLHLDRHLCGPRRCFECPIAAEVLADRRRQQLEADAAQEMSSVLPT